MGEAHEAAVVAALQKVVSVREIELPAPARYIKHIQYASALRLVSYYIAVAAAPHGLIYGREREHDVYQRPRAVRAVDICAAVFGIYLPLVYYKEIYPFFRIDLLAVGAALFCLFGRQTVSVCPCSAEVVLSCNEDLLGVPVSFGLRKHPLISRKRNKTDSGKDQDDRHRNKHLSHRHAF